MTGAAAGSVASGVTGVIGDFAAVAGCREHGQLSPLFLLGVTGKPCLDCPDDQVKVARANSNNDDCAGMRLAALGELAQQRREGVDVVGYDDPAVARREPQHLIVGESRVLRLLVEGADIVSVRAQPGADPGPRDVVVEKQPHSTPD